MKNKVITGIMLGVILMTTACGQSGVATRNTSVNQVEKVLTEQTSDNSESANEIQSSSISQIGNTAQVIEELSLDDMKGVADSDVDIDLTQMTGDMVYASVYNITTNPEEYIGNTIRMNGQCVYSYSDDTGLTYANVVIADAASCCAQGIEFQIGDGELVCPEGYPEEGSEIVVTGMLEIYEEDGIPFLRAGSSVVEVQNY